MTRDEAFERLTQTNWAFSPLVSQTFNTVEAQKIVSALATLGILELEKPRPVVGSWWHEYDRESDQWRIWQQTDTGPYHAGIAYSAPTADFWVEKMNEDRAGLQVMEKENG